MFLILFGDPARNVMQGSSLTPTVCDVEYLASWLTLLGNPTKHFTGGDVPNTCVLLNCLCLTHTVSRFALRVRVALVIKVSNISSFYGG